ncbi:hypothetical protein D3C75_1079590 [compost metagenome]
MSWRSVESRAVYSFRRASVNFRSCTSSEVSMAPWNRVGNRRPSLYFNNGTSGIIEPYLSTVLDTLALAARPIFAYWSAARLGSWPEEGNKPLLLSAGLESSLTPNMPNASTPRPTGPWV